MTSTETRATVDLVGINVFVGGPIQHAIEADGFCAPLRLVLRGIIEVDVAL